MKVLEYLSWVFVGFVIVLEDYNFTPKTLFHLPNFGEGIVEEYANKITIARWTGVAKLIGNNDLANALEVLSNEIREHFKLVVKLKAKRANNTDLSYEELEEGSKKGDIIRNKIQEIHTLIAKELLRIAPNWRAMG